MSQNKETFTEFKSSEGNKREPSPTDEVPESEHLQELNMCDRMLVVTHTCLSAPDPGSGYTAHGHWGDSRLAR